jgi:hypothetical protein
MFIASIFFIFGILFTAYPAYYCHRHITNRNEAEWTRLMQERFDKIPDSYHEAFEKGWDACANSESTILLQYEKFFGRVA